MLNEQLAVREFMESFNQKTREFYAPPLDGERILRARLIMEEAMETAQALLSGTGVNKLFWQGQSITFAPAGGEPRRPEKEDLHHVIDGLCDLLYVTLGSFTTFGISAEPCFAECHRKNLSKFWTRAQKEKAIDEKKGLRFTQSQYDADRFIAQDPGGKVIKPPTFIRPRYYFEA